jgi:CheY-like chemotaxis protein
LAAEIERHNRLYYQDAAPEISDQEYDRLLRELKRLEQVRYGGERVKTIVRDLQTFTRRDDGERRPVLLHEVVEAALSIAAHELRHSISVVRRFRPIPPVLGNTTRFEQLFLNLVLNAAHAVASVDASRHVIEIELRPEDGGRVLAVVRDRGSGMCRDTLARAFEPFFTTKPLGVGTGLGLPICHNIVRAADGDLRLRSNGGAGTTVEVRFPAYRVGAAASSAKSSAPPSTETPLRRASILVVDDEAAISASIAEALRDEHDVEICESALAARELLCSARHFDVVLCDVVMPVLDGAALFGEVRAVDPQLASRFVFMTGGASLPRIEHFLTEVDNPRLMKPFPLSALRAVLRNML